MLDVLQQYSGALSFLASVILIILTGFYAYLTRGILKATANQSRLSLSPVIGIKINSIFISEVFGPSRRNMSISLDLTNVGNAPAIEVLVDAEVELRYSRIDNHKLIPARHSPEVIPFIRPDETIDSAAPNFGNTLITHFFDDVRESSRLNIHRIETNPSQEAFKTSRIHVYVYYRNSLGQYFKSYYITEIGIYTPLGANPIPKEDETLNVNQIYIPRPIFHAGVDDEQRSKQEMKERDTKRKLCGW